MAQSDVVLANEKVGVLIFARQLSHRFLVGVKTDRAHELAVYYGERLLATTDTSATLVQIDPREIFPNLIARRDFYLYYDSHEHRYMGFQPLRNLRGLEVAALGWISLQSPSAPIKESIDKLLLFFGLPLLCLILLCALMLGLWIERPILTLSNVMEAITQTGDLSRRVPVAGGGEIASLSKTFNHMLEQLDLQREELFTFRTMILAMREGLMIENNHHWVTYMNPRMEEMLGIRFKDYHGADDPFILEDRILSRRTIHTDERGIQTEEVAWERPDGRRVQALRTIGKLGEAHGRAHGVLSTFIDVTEQNELQLELIQASRMAFLGVYSQGIIHNLNGPLNTVLGFSTLLCRNNPEAEIPRRIKCDAQRMAGLVMSLAHRWKRAGGTQWEALNLNEIVLEELSFLEADLFFKHNVEKQLELDPALPAIYGVYGDFSHAFLNILINAIEALGESPIHKIGVRTRQHDGEIRLEIEDTGVGIGPEDVGRIFLPFFSTKNRFRKDGIPSGAGLGLAIAHKILEPYGVHFEVQSEVRRGTKMILHIPLNTPPNEAITELTKEICEAPA
jgi:PAS domain S-box-containing protein